MIFYFTNIKQIPTLKGANYFNFDILKNAELLNIKLVNKTQVYNDCNDRINVIKAHHYLWLVEVTHSKSTGGIEAVCRKITQYIKWQDSDVENELSKNNVDKRLHYNMANKRTAINSMFSVWITLALYNLISWLWRYNFISGLDYILSSQCQCLIEQDFQFSRS